MGKHQVVFASLNNNKIAELRSTIEYLGYSDRITVLEASKFTDRFPEELGSSFEQNALIKARYLKSICKDYEIISDDSGLCVDYLGGAPGIYSSRFASAQNMDNNEYLLQKLSGVSQDQRQASFVCCLCYIDKSGTEKLYQASCSGRILDHPVGNLGFGYDPLFYIDSLSKSFSQLYMDEKNRISHRGKAVRMWVEDLLSE